MNIKSINNKEYKRVYICDNKILICHILLVSLGNILNICAIFTEDLRQNPYIKITGCLSVCLTAMKDLVNC